MTLAVCDFKDTHQAHINNFPLVMLDPDFPPV